MLPKDNGGKSLYGRRKKINRSRDAKTISGGRRSNRCRRFAGRASRYGYGAAENGVAEYTLKVGYSERQLGSFKLRTRTYNSSLPGPLMVTRASGDPAGEPDKQSAAGPSSTVPPGVDALNNPHAFNTTNLHVHGLQVVPHLFQPVGTQSFGTSYNSGLAPELPLRIQTTRRSPIRSLLVPSPLSRFRGYAGRKRYGRIDPGQRSYR